MIKFEKAQELVLNHIEELDTTKKRIYDLQSDVLAEDVRSGVDLPLFSNSAMDGYALRSEDTEGAPVLLEMNGSLQAGDHPFRAIKTGEVVKIMTGAPMPPGADAVVMKEDTEERENTVLVKNSVRRGENVRPKGEELKKGQLVLEKGTRLNPAAIGLLSALGQKKVKVIRPPRVFLLITGDELLRPGQALEPGKIWESHTATLKALMSGMNVTLRNLGIARDNPEDLEKCIRKGLEGSDIFLVTGGISVGDYDLVQEILLKLGVRKVFWQVAMKPGKPVFFGTREKTLVFGLPGNPVSVLVTFLEFIRPAIMKMSGYRDILLQERMAILDEPLRKKPGRLYFVRGHFYEKNGGFYARSTGQQNSHILATTASANCLILLDKDRKSFRANEEVRIQFFPWE